IAKAGLDRVPMRVLRPLLNTAVALQDQNALSYISDALGMMSPSRTSMTIFGAVRDSMDHAEFTPDASAKMMGPYIQLIPAARLIAVRPSAEVEDRLAAIALLR